ncbi:MAG TPA: CHC2 zinc finger domain-containing protein [Smithellaceae bacterium]|nr:CHC2 zinc finger domain-containing protein [Smithellaceae bacterium]
MNEQQPDVMAVMEREGVVLHKAGKTYRGKCPMHGGKTSGSLTVYPDSQSWYCWGCGEGGDAIDFIKKLHGLSFKDAISYLGIRPGRPVPVDPAIQRRREIQRNYEKAIKEVYDGLCDRARHLHQVCLQVKKNPGGLTPIGAVLFAGQMGELAEVDHKLDILLTGTFEDQKNILAENIHDSATTIGRAA